VPVLSVQLSSIYGVDFSGARLAGRTTWVARLEPGGSAYTLTDLARLEDLCASAEREAALPCLVQLIRSSAEALWALDFPFGLPVEVIGPGAGWDDQFDFLRAWGDDGYGAGLECVRRAEALGRAKHIRRLTDAEQRAPFDPYHYRVVYQTFFGMRDVLGPLRRDKETAILPFQYRRLRSATRVVVEACPASTLWRLGLPNQNYKQPEGGPLTRRRRRTRNVILTGLRRLVCFTPCQGLTMFHDGGGDALDAVLAAVGAARAWGTASHRNIARHERYPREGHLYVG
jgi:hypothetical protein